MTVRGATLPESVRAALHVSEGDEVAFVDTGRGIVVCPADQAWFWTPEWQEGEREADEQIASGDLSPVFDTVDDMFDHLDRQVSEQRGCRRFKPTRALIGIGEISRRSSVSASAVSIEASREVLGFD